MIISIDGNSIGKMIEKYILAEKLSELEDFSRSISDYLIRIKGIIERYAGKVYMCGGDNILACIDDDNITVALLRCFAKTAQPYWLSGFQLVAEIQQVWPFLLWRKGSLVQRHTFLLRFVKLRIMK